MIKAYSRSRILLTLSLCGLVCLISIVNAPKAKAVPAVTGEPSNVIPNNGAIILNPYVPWLIVSRPGSNGMDGPSSEVYAYWPVAGGSATITISDACDTSVNDKNSANNSTVYNIYNVASVTAVTTNMTIKNQQTVGTISQVSQVECTSLLDVRLTLNPQNNAGLNNTERITINNKQFYKVRIVAKTDPNLLTYYVNRYSIKIEENEGLMGYVAENSPLDVSAYTGIAYDDASASGWGWGTRIGFALPCTTASAVGQIVQFYDTDHINAATSASPYWQDNTNPMKYSIRAYDRKTKVQVPVDTAFGPVPEISGPGYTLTGGNNLPDKTGPFNMVKSKFYIVDVYNVNLVNSIQIQTPYDQVFSSDPCNTLPSGTITANCTLVNGVGSVAVSYSVQDADSDPLTINLTSSGGLPWATKTETYTGTPASKTYTVTGSPFTFSGVYGNTYNITGTVFDGFSSVNLNSSSGSFTCPVPPSPSANISCSIGGVIGGEYEVGDIMPSPVLSAKRAALAGAPSLTLTSVLTLNSVAQTPTTPITTPPGTYTFPYATTAAEQNFSFTYPTKTFVATDLDIGTFTISANVSWPAGPTWASGSATCPDISLSVVKKPFFKVLGGDLSVGGSYGTGSNCSPVSGSGKVYSWVDATVSKGANAAHVAKVLGKALEFYSGSSFVGPGNNKYLTLSNTDAANTWGGNFGSGSCMVNLYSTTKRPDAATVAPGTYSVAQLDALATNDQVSITGGSLTLSGNITFSGQLAIYVDGNVTITSDIINSTSNYTVDPATGELNSPFFALIATGNIYIDGAVLKLEGIYSAGGTLNTCTVGGVAVSDLYANCANQLLINGLVQAQSIKLRRTKYSLSTGAASEVFNGTPELYISKTPFISNSQKAKKYDSASLLPPLL